jgi:signal transduction histidine kinase
MVDKVERRENLVQPQDFAEILTTDWLFRPITVFSYLAITTLPTTASELGRLTDPSLLVAAGIATFSVCVLGILLFVVGMVVPSRLRSSWPLMLLVLMCVGATRGTIVSTYMDTTGLEYQSHLSSRVILSALSVPLVLALVSVVISRIVTSRKLARSTQLSIDETERTRDLVLADISAREDLLLAKINDTLRPAIKEISELVSRPGSRRATIAASLNTLATDLIRPLSHTLAAATEPRDFPQSRTAPQFTAVSPPTFREQVNPVFLGLGIYLGSGTVLLDILPLGSALVSAVIAGAFVYGVTRLMVLAFGNRRSSPLAVTAVNTAVLSVAWLPPHLFNAEFVFPTPIAFQPEVVSVIAVPLLGLAYQLIVLGEYSRRNHLVRLDNTRRDVVFQLSEARRRAWLRQRHLTHTLHSSAQSRVLAEERLVRSGTGSLDPADSGRTVATLESVITSVQSDPPITTDAVKKINEIVEFWSGMCEITVDFDPAVVVESDVEVSEAIHVIVLEMISNAIRHGKATTIAATIVRETLDSIRITAANNGTPIKSTRQSGLGVRLYDELSADWEIRPGKPVTVTALIAARPNTMN